MNDKNSNQSYNKESEELQITSTSTPSSLSSSSSININEFSVNNTRNSSIEATTITTTIPKIIENENETNGIELNTEILDAVVTSSTIDSTNIIIESSSSSTSTTFVNFQKGKEENLIDNQEDSKLEEINKKIPSDSNSNSSNDDIVTTPISPTMGGASSNNDAETCVLPKSSNYIERLAETSKSLNFSRSSSSSIIGGANNITVATVTTAATMSAPTTRSKRKLMNDNELSATNAANSTATAMTTTAATTGTVTHQQQQQLQSRNNSISVNNKSIKLDIKDIKENSKNHQIQPQVSVTTRRSAAAAAAAAMAAANSSSSTTTATAATSATTVISPLKTKSSINSAVGKKSDNGTVGSRNDDNRSIIIMRSSTSARKHLIDREDFIGGESSESSSTNSSSNINNSSSSKIAKKSNCISDLMNTETIEEESQKDVKKDSKNDAKSKTIPIAMNTITKCIETKDGNNSNSSCSSRNPASSSCDIDDKQLNTAGEVRKVEPLKINLNRDVVIKPTKITIKPILKTTSEDDSEETSPPTSPTPIPKLMIKSTSTSNSAITTSTLVASTSNSNSSSTSSNSCSNNNNDDDISGLKCTESPQHSTTLQIVHSEAHIVPKLTIRTSDCTNSLTNSDVTHSVVPKLTIKMDSSTSTSNCEEKDTSSSSTSSPSTSSPSPPPPPLPKLTIKTSSDMSEATILSSSCSSPQKISSLSSACAATSTAVCHIVSGTSTMTSSLSSSQASVPKLTIKTIQIPSSTASTSSSCENNPVVPKLTIKPIPLPVESEDSIRTDDESLSESDTSWQQQQQQAIIPKLTIRTGGQELPSVKIHQHESSISSSDSATINQSIPKLTIRTKPEQETTIEKISTSVPKFTIKTIQETTQSIPKLTISVSDSIASSSSNISSLSPLAEKIPKLTVRQVESDENERIPKLMISRQDDGNENNEKVPKITIKAIQEVDFMEKIPKLTIKPLPEPSSTSENITEKLPKLTIKPIVETETTEKIPKITIKPLQEPIEDTEKLPSFKVTVSSQSDTENFEKIPKLTIKQVQDTDDVDKVPKLTIRSVSSIDAENCCNKVPKIKIKPIQEIDGAVVPEKCPKLTIKGLSELDNPEKIPKLIVKSKDDVMNEKIPKLTIKQIQDTEDRCKSPKLAVFTSVITTTANTAEVGGSKEYLSTRNDFLDINPPKKEDVKETAIASTSTENIQGREIKILKRDGNLNEIPHPLSLNELKQRQRLPEIETIVLTDETPEAEDQNSKFIGIPMERMNQELRKEGCISDKRNEKDRQGSIGRNLTEEDMKFMQKRTLENNKQVTRINSDVEMMHIENSMPNSIDNKRSRGMENSENTNNYQCRNIQMVDKIIPLKNIENVELSKNVPVESSSTSNSSSNSNSNTICIESDDEKTNEEIGAKNMKKSPEKAVGNNFCPSLKEEDVVEALLAVLQQHYQDGGNNNSNNNSQVIQESNLTEGSQSNIAENKLSTNMDSDDDVIIVNPDQSSSNTMDELNAAIKQSEKNNLDAMVNSKSDDSNFQIISEMIDSHTSSFSTTSAASILTEQRQLNPQHGQQQGVIETVDLTLSPKNQIDERYQGNSLLGHLLSQPLRNDLLQKCPSRITTTLPPYNQIWPFGGNMQMHSMQMNNFSDRINFGLEKSNLDIYNMNSNKSILPDINKSTSSDTYESIMNTFAEKKNIHTGVGGMATANHCFGILHVPTSTVINELQQQQQQQQQQQHSPATSLENLLNNMGENSVDDVQYVSSVKMVGTKGDIETPNSKIIQSTQTFLEEEISLKTSNNSQEINAIQNKKISTNREYEEEIDKNEEMSYDSEKFKEITYNVNNNQDIEMVSITQENFTIKEINRPFSNSLKRPSEESDSSDCIEIPANKKSRNDLTDNNTIPDSISLDSEAESVMIPSSDCSLNQVTKDVQSNLTENETSSTISDENEIKGNTICTDSKKRRKSQHENPVDLKILFARMQKTSTENLKSPTDTINNAQIITETIRPNIALIQEGPVRHHSRKSKHSILRNDNEESVSDEFLNNMTDPLLTTFSNSVYDKKNNEIDSGVDVSGSLQSETGEIQRQPLKRPRGRPRKDGLPAGSVKKLPRTVTSNTQASERDETPPNVKRKYKRRLLHSAESPTSQVSSTPSDASKDSIPVLTPSIEVNKRSDTPSALSSCSVPSPEISHLTPEIPMTNSLENTSPTSVQPRTSSSSFPTTPSPKETSATPSTPVELNSSSTTTAISSITEATSTTTPQLTKTEIIVDSSPPSPKTLTTPEAPASNNRRGGRSGKSARGRGRGGIARNRPRCIGGLSHTPEIARDGPFFSPERRKVLDIKSTSSSSQSSPHEKNSSSAPQVFEEDTRMSADSIVAPTPPQSNRQSEITNNDDTQSSVLSSTSISIDGNANSSTATISAAASIAAVAAVTTTITPVVVGSKKKVKSKMEVTAPEGKTEYTVDMIAEYDWPPPKGCCPAKNRDTFMIQEQIAQYLGIKSFKRKYPDLPRRQIDMEERNWLQEKGLVTEKMCDLGITAVWASDVLDIMYSDFYDKYEEYKTYIRQKHLRDVEAKQKALAAEAVDRTLQARDRALQSAAKWNSNFNRTRKEDRRLCLDLQNLVINIPKSKETKKLNRPEDEQSQPPSHYPVALVPGQYSEYYRHFTPEELRQYPLNTVLDFPESIRQRLQPQIDPENEGDKVDNESELNSISSSSSDDDSSSSGSDNSGSDSSSDDDDDDSDSDSSSSSDDEDVRPDEIKCFVCHQRQNKNLHGFPEVFVRCYTCRRRTHPSCIDMPHRMANRVRNYNWQCAECKCCIKCKRKIDESKMIYCEQCDRGYHIYCIKIKSVPEGRWDCEHCAICMRCGTNKPEGNVPLPPPPPNSKWKPKRKWIHEYRMDPVTKLREHVSILCAPCARLKRNPKPPS